MTVHADNKDGRLGCEIVNKNDEKRRTTGYQTVPELRDVPLAVFWVVFLVEGNSERIVGRASETVVLTATRNSSRCRCVTLENSWMSSMVTRSGGRKAFDSYKRRCCDLPDWRNFRQCRKSHQLADESVAVNTSPARLPDANINEYS
ncbi:hypothetical protein DFH08DRAFT_811185 [Mycena albidolilacea]|uniref:Uncharacterized protein n=1 Tax=Mycena albidolilacea TaxID=1033008 RepID=A0AAD6ZXJ3_9AGAR|nr:hypothetical protein DFH08DRAFT_811185 [Mycena albidolilacea]